MAVQRRRLVAVTREVSPAFAACELTHLAREPIDVRVARQQHAAYVALLEELRCAVEHLPAEPSLPDSVFVEDAAVVVDELAVITRPGAASRRGETASVAAALARHRPLARIEAPATLDGGDVLRIGRRLFAGLSSRTSRDGVDQLAALLAPFGYAVEGVELDGCLHLKTAVTEVAEGTVIINPAWIGRARFAAYEQIEVDADEPFAANALRVAGDGTDGDTVVVPAAFPRTADRLAAHGLRVRTVDVAEIAKAEGGVTCCSILLAASAAQP
ncbi:MAG TPA: arginine deiminase family protein [Thermoanaerobaculia bacterium]|jgi:dimethylargininase|nr:arginine deiminase family protein [Thermoanaerobaculia bacterium]